MTRTPNESIPFADIEEDEFLVEMQATVERQINLAYELGDLEESTYVRLCIEVCEIYGDPYDHFTRILDDIIAAAEISLLDRLVIGDEFIESLEKDDPRYPRAVARYEQLHERFRRMKERESA